MKLTKKKAKKLSILKWESHVIAGGEDDYFIEENPEFELFENECPFCELFIHESDKKTGLQTCYGCPLKPILENYNFDLCGCLQNGHPYAKWDDERTEENAQGVLNLIKNS